MIHFKRVPDGPWIEWGADSTPPPPSPTTIGTHVRSFAVIDKGSERIGYNYIDWRGVHFTRIRFSVFETWDAEEGWLSDTPNIQLVSGQFFDLVDPTPDMIHISDIGHALSMLCRYNGHCADFYSIAQHSVLVSHIVPEHLAMVGLLHDAAEAYLGDVTRPLKQLLGDYEYLESRIWRAICDRFDFGLEDYAMPGEVKFADNQALVTEVRDLMPAVDPERDGWYWARSIPRLESIIKPVPHFVAKGMFLDRFNALRLVHPYGK